MNYEDCREPMAFDQDSWSEETKERWEFMFWLKLLGVDFLFSF